MHELLFWHWWILAGVLLVGEILTFTSFLLWISVAAFITGITKFFAPTIDWQWQLVLFAFLSMVGIFITIMFFKNKKGSEKTGYNALNSRAESYVGKKFTLSTPVINGSGKIKVGDTYWLIHCDEDLADGTKIEVVSTKGTTLIVKKSA